MRFSHLQQVREKPHKADSRTVAPVGRHYLVELMECNPQSIMYTADVEAQLIAAVKASHARYLSHHMHQFLPCGVSGVVLIAESHLSLHTWPEASLVAFDVFTCGEEMDPLAAIRLLEQAFQAKRSRISIIERGA